MENILVTGSEGAIGNFVVDQIYHHHNDVRVIRIGRNQHDNQDKRSKYYWGDLTDVSFLQNVFAENKIDTIISCAALWNGINQDKHIFDNNVMLTSSLMHAISSDVQKVVFLSSSAVYQPQEFSDKVEIVKYPNSTYGGAKLLSEMMLRDMTKYKNFDFTIYRPFHVVSPLENFEMGRSHVCTNFCHKMITNKEILDIDSLPHKSGIGFLWVGDIATTIVQNLLLEGARNQIFNIGTQDEHSIKELAIEIKKQAEVFGLIESFGDYASLNDLPRQADGRFDKLHSLKTFQSTPFADCVTKFIEHKYL